jgi:hypothetical protein
LKKIVSNERFLSPIYLLKGEKMNRIEHVLELPIEKIKIDSFGLANAFICCLTPPQACELLQRCVVLRIDLRNSTIRKICNDIDISYSHCHERLLTKLMRMLPVADLRGRNSIGYCLAKIADHVRKPERHKILKCFLMAEYIEVRKRGYKCIANNLDSNNSLLLEAWEKFNDGECAWLIVKYFPEEFLIKNRRVLLSVFSENWQFARLYLRIGKAKPRMLKELKSLDQISYCYVIAKLDGHLDLKEAIQIVDGNAQNDRFDLLVWSLGRLRLWPALEYIENHQQNIREKRLAYMRVAHNTSKKVPVKTLES